MRGYKRVDTDVDLFDDANTKKLTFWELLYMLRPYFWPSEGSDGAIINRIRALSTWIAVTLSKVTGLVSPFFLAAAADDLSSLNFRQCVINSSIYVGLRIGSSVLKEFQSILYVRVKQQAGVELQELTFRHVHTLSLNWHVSKKTGSVMKSMDRGIAGVDTLITYMFLFLVPALLECLAVVLLFFIQYQQWGLGLSVLIGVFLYIVATIGKNI
jgi:ABC-type multidrug transport system fused ATPase/permease subunit